MRKWSFVLFCLTALAGLVLLVGCEGDAGLTGIKGAKGRLGTVGYDPDRLPPADRPIAFGVINSTENAVSGRKQIYLTFDSTARGTKDTVAANRVSVPPLIDGKDDEDFEWGPEKSKISNMTFLNPDPGSIDCQLSRATIRAAYDDENIYMMFQWTETQFTARIPQPDGSVDTVEVTATDFNEPGELRFIGMGLNHERYAWDRILKDSADLVQYYEGCRLETKPDTIWTSMRVSAFDSCRTFFLDSCFCYITVSGLKRNTQGRLIGSDTTWVWKQNRKNTEDRLVVFIPSSSATGWQDAAFKSFFGFSSGNPPGISSDLLVDAWSWGAATTRPVGTADDWSVTASGKKPDVGQGPYFDNFVEPDSVPLYMNRRDPNLRTSEGTKMSTPTYPLWFFEAVGFSWTGWTQDWGCFVPGIVTTIPSESRADIYAAAAFDNGTWTVEIKRARKTHHGDDVQF